MDFEIRNQTQKRCPYHEFLDKTSIFSFQYSFFTVFIFYLYAKF